MIFFGKKTEASDWSVLNRFDLETTHQSTCVLRGRNPFGKIFASSGKKVLGIVYNHSALLKIFGATQKTVHPLMSQASYVLADPPTICNGVVRLPLYMTRFVLVKSTL